MTSYTHTIWPALASIASSGSALANDVPFVGASVLGIVSALVVAIGRDWDAFVGALLRLKHGWSDPRYAGLTGPDPPPTAAPAVQSVPSPEDPAALPGATEPARAIPRRRADDNKRDAA
ncbi:hypothetical protein [Baekduia sp. Peel2402]|uniref:hypothetical protein n=1 Tax=Baekduia sp. Peel2402 TaxID=3458296 RepID=UPI00403E4615